MSIVLDQLSKLPAEIRENLRHFFTGYVRAVVEGGEDQAALQPIMLEFIRHIERELQSPTHFPVYHPKEREPIDFYAFGTALMRPLVDLSHSAVVGLEQVQKMVGQLSAGDNVILLANHQTEPDPQLISLLLEKNYGPFAEEMIFVAGDRVTRDPMAVPFSRGCNLLCVHSKRHMDHPPEQKEQKLSHNRKAMSTLGELLVQGGRSVYVAPSGGRDRANAQGFVEVSPFDPQAIELFALIAKQAKRPTHFYPLALYTFHLLPPPRSIGKELGEERRASRTPIFASFGPEIDWEGLPGLQELDKHARRTFRAQAIQAMVEKMYRELRERSESVRNS